MARTRGPVLYGADYSVYTRIARLALFEKGVDHDFVPVDVFAADGVPAGHLERHPFGRIPAFEHDGLRLYETAAITRYVDEGFSGPALQPAAARDRAAMQQMIGILDSYAYRTLVWDIYVERVGKAKDGKPTDENRVADALPRARTILAAIAALKRRGPWLLGDRPTLADCHAAPMFVYFVRAPDGQRLLDEVPVLAEWHRTAAQLRGHARTEFPA